MSYQDFKRLYFEIDKNSENQFHSLHTLAKLRFFNTKDKNLYCKSEKRIRQSSIEACLEKKGIRLLVNTNINN